MGRRMTIKDVAKEANVSVATVSYVLNGKDNISADTQLRVRKAVQKLGYVTNLSARSMTTNESRLIGVIIPQTEPGERLLFHNAFYSEMVGSIEFHARNQGYHILVTGSNTDEDYLRIVKQRDLEGLIIVGIYPDAFYTELKKAQIPIVLVDSYCQDFYFHNVQINDRYGGYLATKHLLECGHREIAMVVSTLRSGGVSDARFNGYKDALEEYGVPFRKEYVFEANVDFESAKEQARKIISSKHPITAVFAFADLMAVGLIKEFSNLGVRVPDDISIVGFDDLDLSRLCIPSLTTIHQDIQEKGAKAVEILLSDIKGKSQGKQEVVLPISLVRRDSVKILSEKKPQEKEGKGKIEK